ncbi:tRNA processing endoribonuclease [Colletotrichum kahawae]|uniref:tRNA processing endoribonuclease n=1 Tax=Colletotrichum kahawae TaxID=34407 RepID=A0AAE0CYK2_COLKA|nr:tRNA processing endoribonuclease [Colletotrichum kahawae]
MDQPPRPGSPPRRLRACVPCTRAKARCNFREENAGKHLCDRCDRLKIECAAKTTRGVRRPRQLKPLVNRVASLEQQITSLVTTDKPDSISASSSRSSTSDSNSPQSCAKDKGDHDTTSRQHTSGAVYPCPAAQEGLNNPGAPPFGFTWAQASFILSDFRDKFTPNFPFVIIDRQTSPQDLLREKPFLFRAVMLAAAPLPRPRIADIRSDVLAYLGHRMLLENEETLDLLQGILVIVMWADIKYFYDKQITRLVYLALGYAHSIGITRIPLSVLGCTGTANTSQPDDCFASRMAASMTQHHTPEEQRAFLGLFYVVTVNSNQFARRNPLLQQNGGGGSGGGVGGLYVDICCESLARSGTPEDALGVKMVRFMQISGRIAEVFGSFANRATGESYATLFEAQAVAIRREVDRVAEEIDPRDPYFSYLWMQYNSVLVQLYEPAIKAATSTPLHRTTCLLDCLAAARAYYDAFTALPPDQFLYRTSASISHAQTVVTVTTRLLVLEVEGWDLESARASLDFLDVTERMAGLFRRTVDAGRERMEQFSAETGATYPWIEDENTESRGGTCEELVEKMEWIGDWYRSKLEAEEGKMASDKVNRELLEEIARIWQWSPNVQSLPFFGGLLNPLDVSYESI